MYTIAEFTSRWKRLHHPAMNVDGDVAFYYQLYGRLHHLIGQEARCFDSHKILPFLLYIENTVAIGLDGVYEYRYRSVGNVKSRWCDGLEMSANAASEVHNLVGKAVADAKYSALRQWMAECVLSGDFTRLNEMLTWFVREDKVLRSVFQTCVTARRCSCGLRGTSKQPGGYCGQTLPSTGATSAVIPWRLPLPNSSVMKLLSWKRRKKRC